jgi:dephospho-CoA kinase
MIKTGLTGNIGSGKSMVSRIFETLGVPVFHADTAAKKLLTDESIQQAIMEQFGGAVITEDKVDRKKLASVVFEDKSALTYLNTLIHPMVRQDLMKWFERHKDYPYVIQEAAILFESGFYKEFDKIITVAAPADICIQRVMLRDGLRKEEVEKRMENQWKQEKKMELSHYIIYNNETQLVIPQVMAIHHELSK